MADDSWFPLGRTVLDLNGLLSRNLARQTEKCHEKSVKTDNSAEIPTKRLSNAYPGSYIWKNFNNDILVM
jgi:hypothetical protein